MVIALPTRMSTPIRRSRRSVWSRVRTDSWTAVTPSACRAASSTAVLTWALGTSIVTEAPRRRRPVVSMGGVPPGLVFTLAPRLARGVATRCIGRRDNEASPTRRASTPGVAASAPVRNRIVLPELPQSRSALG